MLVKKNRKGWEYEQEDLSSYYMALRKQGDSGTSKRKH
jgi:hypothetical protein